MIMGYEIVIGRVLSPHGTGGMVKVFPYSDFPERVHLLDEVEVEKDSGHDRYTVEKGAVHGRYWLIKFQGVNTRTDACKLGGALVRIPREERVPLPEGTFYHDQLIGLQVNSAEGRLLGTIIDVIKNGGHDQLVVAKPGEKDKTYLIPAVKKIVRLVDLPAGVVTVDLPEGILDL